MNYKHATIVPLIGGLPLGQEAAFGTDVEYILSYPPFANNDQHFVKHKGNIPYMVIDENFKDPVPYVDVIGTTCPCAGLSSLSPSSNSNSPMNDWMYETAEYVLGTLGPKVLWGENAPRLASAMGEPVVKRLKKIGEKNGYTLSIYKTKSILHGLSQVRDRTFYFFWKGTTVPVFDYIQRPYMKIEDAIRSVERLDDDPLNVLTNEKTPSQDPLYRYLLEVIEGGISHKEFTVKQEKSLAIHDYIERSGHEYKDVAVWMRDNGFERNAISCERMHKKLKSGGNIMRKGTTIPSNYIGAFVGHLPNQLTHPDEDRYLTIREAASIMKLPSDFILHGGKKNLNHLCQNVPVTTATDMANQIIKHLNGELETIDTNFMIQCNKSHKLNYTQIGVQLDEFMV